MRLCQVEPWHYRRDKLAANLYRRMSRQARRSHDSGIESELTSTQEKMGIEGETEGKTNNIRKEKQSTPSPTARTEQAQELVFYLYF